MIKIIILFGALLMIFLMGCTIQKDIVKPIEPEPIEQPELPIQLSDKEECEQQGNLFVDNLCLNEQQLSNKQRCELQGKLYFSGLSEGCFDKEIIQVCENGGGTWSLFSNGCVDSCGQKPRICTQALAWGCDCGATQCYGNIPCVTTDEVQCLDVIRLACKDDPFEPYATQQEACEATGGEIVLGEGGGCNFQTTGELCGGIQGLKCPEGECIYEGNVKIAPFPDAQGKCSVTLCTEPPLICQCPKGQTFTLQGCVEDESIQGLLSTIAYR